MASIQIAISQNVAEVWGQPTVVRPCPRAVSQQVFAIGEGVVAPVLVSKVQPAYTREAREARLEGVVVISAVIDQKGRTCDERVVRTLGLGLDEKAIESVGHWRFKPALKEGKPVPAHVTLEVRF